MKKVIIILAIISIYYFLIHKTLYDCFMALFIYKNDPSAMFGVFLFIIPWWLWFVSNAMGRREKEKQVLKDKIEKFLDQNTKP